MSWLEIFKEVATKGLRAMNEEINATAPAYHTDAPEEPVSPLVHTRPGFEKYHPAYYEDAPRPTARVA